MILLRIQNWVTVEGAIEGNVYTDIRPDKIKIFKSIGDANKYVEGLGLFKEPDMFADNEVYISGKIRSEYELDKEYIHVETLVITDKVSIDLHTSYTLSIVEEL